MLIKYRFFLLGWILFRVSGYVLAATEPTMQEILGQIHSVIQADNLAEQERSSQWNLPSLPSQQQMEVLAQQQMQQQIEWQQEENNLALERTMEMQ